MVFSWLRIKVRIPEQSEKRNGKEGIKEERHRGASNVLEWPAPEHKWLVSEGIFADDSPIFTHSLACPNRQESVPSEESNLVLRRE